MSEADRWLQRGITAVKAGNHAEGREWLMKALETDDHNEQAWLWLSGAVTSPEERRICLENVLTLNPENSLAQKGLAKLEETAVPPDASVHRQTIRRQRAAVSTAQALLYPERQEETWEWVDPTPGMTPGEATAYQAEETYDDVWTHDVDICGHCAQELAEEDTKCPNCQRNLLVKTFQYEKSSPNLVIFWVLLLSLGQLYLIQVIFDVVVERNVLLAAFDTILMGIFFVLAIGAYFRQVWAYPAGTLMFALVLIGGLLRLLAPFDLTPLNLGVWDQAITEVSKGLVDGLGIFLRGFRLLTAVLGLVTAIFWVPSDFARTQQRQIARLGRRLKTGRDYDLAARRLTEKGLWATAVLHWQRAAALEPYRLPYQINLGRAYARLGFRQRALDTFTAVRQRTTNTELQAKLDKLIQASQTANQGD